jgi:formate dehydrogenase subunit beta
MLVPIHDTPDKLNTSQLIDNPERLNDVNPFKPIMLENAARKIPTLLNQFPKAKIGVILRPCEMRGVNELAAPGSTDRDRLLTISIDCLKTLPVEDYYWWMNKKAAADKLTQQALQFARQGGIAAYRYRSACQMCFSPEASDADINISILGLPVRQQLLVQVPDDATAARLNLEIITDGIASPVLIAQHQKIIAKMQEHHDHSMHQITGGLGGVLPKDIDALISQLESCAPCEACMDACPICSAHRPKKNADGHYPHDEVIRWLIACTGCGMCEQACLSHLPLGAIFRQIREEIVWIKPELK